MEEKDKYGETFQVKESKAMNIVLSIIFWIMFFSAINYNEFSNSNPQTTTRLFYLTIIPAILFSLKIGKNDVIIEVNKLGIFYNGAIITTWPNFISARYSQEEKIASISDNFVLFIDYLNVETGTEYISKIALGKTQNKSEEEIIAAIEHFHMLSQSVSSL